MKIGSSVSMYFADGSTCFNSDSVFGVVCARSPRRIVVWTGTTGFGQRRWPFDNRGRPVGHTAVAFPELRVDLDYIDPFVEADSSDVKHYRSDAPNTPE
jgi:hypothetical protein